MEVRHTPNHEEGAYALVGDDGEILRRSNRRRDLVKMMEGGLDEAPSGTTTAETADGEQYQRKAFGGRRKSRTKKNEGV